MAVVAPDTRLPQDNVKASRVIAWCRQLLRKGQDRLGQGGRSWGLALVVAVALFGLATTVFMTARSAPAIPASSTALTQAAAASTALSRAATSPAALVKATESKPQQKAASWTTFTVRSGDTLAELFGKAGLDATECQRVMALGTPVRTLRLLHPGDKIRLRTDDNRKLTELQYIPDELHTLEISAGPSGLQAHLETVEPITERTVVSSEVNETLGKALQKAGLSKVTSAEFVGIFHWRVNFRREIRRGTRFTVVYDKRRVGDKKLSPGPIVAAKLVLHGQTLQAFRFAGADGEAGYYDAHGRSMHPTLLRTPVHYTRISSPFSLHRFDPVVHVWRPHYGVDLAAPSGTPVEAAGDGRIVFIGRDGGYGNLIKIDNFGPYTTRYAHLRRFAHGLHVGSHVHQGQIIAYVGETGEATGPHLHFEIRVNGRPHNPLTVKLPAGEPLSHRERRHFEASIQPLVAMLDNTGQGQPQLARNENGRFTVASRQ